MSVFGGDSWAREAQCRKRRVDDLLIDGVEASAYKKLSNGKFACLFCPNCPVLDNPVMLSTHVNGSRHRAAELRRKDRELATQEEVKKRLALSDCVSSNGSTKQCKTSTTPLIERTRQATSDVFRGEVYQQKVKSSEIDKLVMPRVEHSGGNANPVEPDANQKGVVVEAQRVDYQARVERKLKFTAAGWKRDCHGRWFKDENVEFDSDEEDPNIVLQD